MSAESTKKTRDSEMRDHYDFSGGVRGKYAKRFAEGTNVVVLDPDVADVSMEEVRQALLKAGFTAEQIHLEVTQSGNVGGFVISPRFAGQSQVDRQEALWAHLRRLLTTDRLHRIVSILTMTPEEIDDNRRAANG